MRNRYFILLFSIVIVTAKLFADTTSVALDSAEKPFIPPNQGPLGIDNMTGLALFGVAILISVFVIALWRRNIMKKRDNND
jgi:hypothetical protein